MTVVMGKQYVYSQHQSMVCALWLALPLQSEQAAEKCARPPGLTTKWLRPLLCLTWPHLSIEALGLQGNILWLQVNFFSVTLSAGRVQGGSGLLWTQFCSQIPQKHLSSPANIYSSRFQASSKLILPLSLARLHILPQDSGSPMSTEPGPSPCHASKHPLLLALGHWGPLGFEIICPRFQYMSQ